MAGADNIFNPKHAAFGRAQTFPLRLGWLPKVCGLFADGKGRRTADELMSEWGVGKNMALAMLHWALAADVLDDGHSLTDFGRRIFCEKNGLDPYMEDEATLWLLHWKIVSRPRRFTAGYWLFNMYLPGGGFSPEEAAKELRDIFSPSFSDSVMRRDVDTVLRMYARRGNFDGDESLESPFLHLNLIFCESTGAYYCDADPRDSLPANVIGYAAAERLAATGEAEMALRTDTRAGNGASVGAVFRIDDDALLQKLEDFCREFPDYQLKEYAGEWQFYKSGGMFPLDGLLAAAYSQKEARDAV